MSDRMIKVSEIFEPNSLTLLGRSNQMSKLTSGGRLQAQTKLKMAILSLAANERRQKGAKMGCFGGGFWTFWREDLRFGPKNSNARLTNTPSMHPREGLVEQ